MDPVTVLVLLFILGIVGWILAYRPIEPGHAGKVVTLSRAGRVVGSGPHFIIPFIQRIDIVSTKVEVLDPPPQLFVTKDDVPVLIDIAITAFTSDPGRVLYGVERPLHALYVFTKQAIQKVVSQYPYRELKDRAAQFGKDIRTQAAQQAENFGLTVVEDNTLIMQQVVPPKAMLQAAADLLAAKDRAAQQVVEARAEAKRTRIEMQTQGVFWIRKAEADALVDAAKAGLTSYTNLRLDADQILKALTAIADASAKK